MISLKRKKIIGAILVIFCLLFSVFLYKPKEQEEQIEELEVVEKEETEEKLVWIDIKGAVKNPGVYSFKEGTRLEEALKKAGGLLESADVMTINLSKKVEDEMVFIIYTKEEIETMKQEEQRVGKIDNTCVCPKIQNDAVITNSISNYENSTQTNNQSNKKISLNSATAEELQTLSGIGPSKASAIIQYREEHGGFSSIEEVKNVSGIGEVTFEKIKDSLTL